MFDVFDILVSELATDSRLEVRREQTAFDPSDDAFVYVNGAKFAQVVTARQAYTNCESWTGAPGRGGWAVLLAAPPANAAAAADETWVRFLRDFVLVLRAHSAWRVCCESDCEQHPLEVIDLSPEDLSEVLDSHRCTGGPIALQVSAL